MKTFITFRNWIFKPPYYGVPWMVWLYAVIACLCYTNGGVFAGVLTGYDDHTRMMQVLNWVNGASWYDRVITRVNAPEGFQTIWARLVDIPFAVVILIGQQFTTQRQAVLGAAFIVPFLELGVLFTVAPYFARPLVGKKYARLIILFLMFTSVMNYKAFSMSGFASGEVSHHAWYIILVLLMFGAASRLAAGVNSPAPARMMGIAIALLLAVGIEGFPLIAGALLMLAIVAWLFNRPVITERTLQAMIYATLLSLLLLPLHQPPSQWFSISFAEPSILGPILTTAAALFFIAQKFIITSVYQAPSFHKIFSSRFWARKKIYAEFDLFFSNQKKKPNGIPDKIAFLCPKAEKNDFSGMTTFRKRILSLIGMLLVISIISGGILLAFPQMLAGPAAALSPAERVLAFKEHVEVWPLYKVALDQIDFIGLAMPSLIAIGAAIYAIRQTRSPRRRALLLSYFGFTLIASGLAECIARFYHHAMTVACAWLLWAWQRIKNNIPRNRHYALKALGVFIILGPFWMLLLPALDQDLPFVSQVLLYPAKVQTFPDPCNNVAFGAFLNQHFNKNTLLIVPGAESSRMLFYSDLKIDFLNNYPSQNKFIDNETFFATQDMGVAKDIAMRHGIDLVALCRPLSSMPPLKPGEEPMLYERLQNGQPPAWLKPVNTGLYGYHLYEVDKQLLMK